MALTLDQSDGNKDKPDSDTIKHSSVIGRQAHCYANSFYKAIIFRQFLLHLQLTLAQRGLSYANGLERHVRSRPFLAIWQCLGIPPGNSSRFGRSEIESDAYQAGEGRHRSQRPLIKR